MSRSGQPRASGATSLSKAPPLAAVSFRPESWDEPTTSPPCRQEIESLLVNWTGPDLSGFGELVLEGSFKVQRVKKERAFFLFDRMLLIAKKRLEQFVYSTHIFVGSPPASHELTRARLHLMASRPLSAATCCWWKP